MSGPARTVLLTRPGAESRALAAEVEKRGLIPFIEPMLEIVYLDVTLPDPAPFQALVFTSANGVDAFARLGAVRDIPVFTVGDATGARAAERGFGSVTAGNGDLAELNRMLATAGLKENVPVLHISGAHTAGAIVIRGVPVERLIAYRADKSAALGAACLRHMDNRDFTAAMFYSPRTAQTFAALLAQAGRTEKVSTIIALCISPAVVKCIDHLPWRDVRAADAPTRNGMSRLLDALAAAAGPEAAAKQPETEQQDETDDR